MCLWNWQSNPKQGGVVPPQIPSVAFRSEPPEHTLNQPPVCIVACDANQIGEWMPLLPQQWNCSLLVFILCCSYPQGFHENKLKGRQKGEASWEACIVNMSHRCFLCMVKVWELFLFSALCLIFLWLVLMPLPPSAPGARHLFKAFGKHSLLFICSQFDPGLNLQTASNIHCYFQKLGLERSNVSESKPCLTVGDPVSLSARLTLNHQAQLVSFKEIPRCYLTFKHMDCWSKWKSRLFP